MCGRELMQLPFVGVVQDRKQVYFYIFYPSVEPFELVEVVEERSRLLIMQDFLVLFP